MPVRWLVGLVLLLFTTPVLAVAVTGGMRVVVAGDEATVRLALSEPLAAPPRFFALDNPRRLVVDLDQASSMRREADGNGAVRRLRVAQFDPATARLVIELTKPMQLVAASQDGEQVLELKLQPADDAGFRGLIAHGRAPIADFRQQAPLRQQGAGAADARAESAARMASIESALANAEQALDQPAPARGPVDLRANAPVAAPPLPARPARPVRTRPYVVVLDAGHGGNDPGAPSGHSGSEKDVTLAIARAAKASLESLAQEKSIPITVRLTRDSDHFVPLGGRVRMARDWQADLFISVHADSAPNPDARGASVYTLSEVASDREAARVAAKENRADLIAGVDLSSENREVANILVDLGRRDFMNASADFAELLKDGLEPEGVGFRSQFHRFANFQVLRNLGVAAVLLETGYLSNRADNDYLFSRKGQQAIANGIATSALRYLDRH